MTERGPRDNPALAHARACQAGEARYTDPASGLLVFTEIGLKARGRCCGCGCRHCPYDHENVAVADRAERAMQPAWLTEQRPAEHGADVLFWSGGKDSWLAYCALQRANKRPIVLLTTFDAATRRVAHQEVAIASIVRQASALDVPLLGVPLFPGERYEQRVGAGLALVPNAARLVFGDLHLEHIRDWREQHLGALADARQAQLHFPLWGQPYARLMDDLQASGVPCTVSAVTTTKTQIRVGDRFDRAFVADLPDGIDAFGENGEFHTLAEVWAV